MYALGRGSSTKIASKATRRGPSQQIDKFESRESISKREPFGPAAMSAARPVFNGRKNYNRSNIGSNSSSCNMTQEPVNPQHEETVRFVADAWHRVQHDFEISSRQGREGGPEYYREKSASHIEGFEPIDLEQWWGNRTLDKITQ